MIVKGKQIAENILDRLKKRIEQGRLKLDLAAILVGDDPEFKKFVELKGRAAEKIGIGFRMFQFAEDIDEKELIRKILVICKNSNGILVELPLPAHMDQQAILDAIPAEKDVDVLSVSAQGSFYSGSPRIMPPSAEALKILFEELELGVKNKKVAVFGYGLLIGKPIAYWLERNGAEVSIIRSKTENPAQYSRDADIVIAGVGKPGLITGDMVKQGAVIIDYGYGKKDCKMVGDVDFDSVSPKAGLITPVPGGMGPILIAAVLNNLITLNEK